MTQPNSSYSPEQLKSKAEQLAQHLPYNYGCIVVAIVNAYINHNLKNRGIAEALLLDTRKKLNQIIRTTR